MGTRSDRTPSQNTFPSDIVNPLIQFSQDGTVLYANAAARTLLVACEPDQPPPTAVPAEWLHVLDTLAQHPAHAGLIQHCGDVTYSLTFVPDIQTRRVTMYGVLLTNSIHTGNALTNTEEQLRSLIASMEDLVFTIDLDGCFLVYHQAADTSHDTPITPSQRFIGKRYDTILPPEMSALLTQTIEQVKAALRTEQFEYSLTIDHEMRYFSARVSPLISPAVTLTGFTVVSSDITATKLARQRQQHMLELEQLHRAIATVFLKTNDPDDALLHALALAGQSLDVSRAYLLNYDQSSALFSHSQEWCAPGVLSLLSKYQPIPFEQIVPAWFPAVSAQDITASYFDITQLPDHIQAALVEHGVQTLLALPFYVEGRLYGFAGFDETRYERQWQPEEGAILRAIVESYTRMLERHTARRELITARDAALQSAQVKSEFISNISHEIRTPLTHVLGTLDLLSETVLDASQRELIDAALNRAHHLLEVMTDVLDFSQLERGHMTLGTEPFDLRALLYEIETLLRPQAQAKQIALTLHIADEVPPRLLGDPARLRQVLIHLVGNGIKFTPVGSVKVRIQPTAIINELISLRFTVSDTGIGIAPEHHRQIFNSFEQADGSTTRRYGGTGLGLAIAQQIVQLMGGSISVRSDPGQGSVFEFTITLEIR